MTHIGHAPLAIDRLLDVRTTKWQKQLPTNMQCRSHSRRRTIECLFVTAWSMDQYAEEKRTWKNLFLRNGISEAETTNNKRLRSTFCIEARQTRSIARPLCDSRASCSLKYGDISIFKMAAVRHLGIGLPPYETTHEVCCWPQLPLKFHVNLIHRFEFCAYLAWNGPKWGFWGLWTSKCNYSSLIVDTHKRHILA